MAKLLDGKVAIVTGAGSGIGRACALHLARAGAAVVVSDIDDVGGADTARQIGEQDGRARYVHADTSKVGDHEALVAAARQAFGGLHIAVNNAGISGPAAPVGEYPVDGWDRVIAVNLSGVFYGMRAQLPAMAEAGGAIVNMASILAQVGFRQAAAYVAAKHGLVGLTQTAALEYGPHKIRINAVGPGFINTPLLDRGLTAEQRAALAGQHAMGRLLSLIHI